MYQRERGGACHDRGQCRRTSPGPGRFAARALPSRDADVRLRELPPDLVRSVARRGRPLSLGDRRRLVRPGGGGHSDLAQRREPAGSRRPHARAPGLGGEDRARGAIPISLHRPRPPGRAGHPRTAHARGTRRAGGHRRRHPQPPGRRGRAVFAGHEQPLVRRQGRRLPGHRGPRRRLGAGRVAAPAAAPAHGGARRPAQEEVSRHLAGLDGRGAPERGPADRERRRRPARRGPGPSPLPGAAALCVRERDCVDPADLGRHPRDRVFDRRGRVARPVLHDLDPHSDTGVHDRPGPRDRLRPPDGESVPRGPLLGDDHGGRGRGVGAAGGLDDLPLRVPGVDQFRRAPDDSPLRAAIHRRGGASRHVVRLGPLGDPAAGGALAPWPERGSPPNPSQPAGPGGRGLGRLAPLGAPGDVAAPPVSHRDERSASPAGVAGAPAGHDDASRGLAAHGAPRPSRPTTASRGWAGPISFTRSASS